MPLDDLTTLFAGTGIFAVVITVLSCVLVAIVTVGAIILVRRLLGPSRKLLETGIAGEATILRMWQTGLSVNDQPQMGMLLEVRLPGREPYQTEHKMVIPLWNMMQFQQGAVVPVKVDPDNPRKLALDVYE